MRNKICEIFLATAKSNLDEMLFEVEKYILSSNLQFPKYWASDDQQQIIHDCDADYAEPAVVRRGRRVHDHVSQPAGKRSKLDFVPQNKQRNTWQLIYLSLNNLG